jgi:hypothetical protein
MLQQEVYDKSMADVINGTRLAQKPCGGKYLFFVELLNLIR